MLKLLLATLGTWSVVSLFMVGALGFLMHLREQKALRNAWTHRAKLRGSGEAFSVLARNPSAIQEPSSRR
jgi:hypothetical protein